MRRSPAAGAAARRRRSRRLTEVSSKKGMASIRRAQGTAVRSPTLARQGTNVKGPRSGCLPVVAVLPLGVGFLSAEKPTVLIGSNPGATPALPHRRICRTVAEGAWHPALSPLRLSFPGGRWLPGAGEHDQPRTDPLLQLRGVRIPRRDLRRPRGATAKNSLFFPRDLVSFLCRSFARSPRG